MGSNARLVLVFQEVLNCFAIIKRVNLILLNELHRSECAQRLFHEYFTKFTPIIISDNISFI